MYDELIKALHDGAEFLECSTPGIKNSFAKMCHNAADAIEELTDRNVGKWIPVTEQLPKDLERVLINDEDGVTIGTMDVFVGNEETYYEWHDTHCYRVFPTHWMPLPEPPKEET